MYSPLRKKINLKITKKFNGGDPIQLKLKNIIIAAIINLIIDNDSAIRGGQTQSNPMNFIQPNLSLMS